jgi:hypothetical protein
MTQSSITNPSVTEFRRASTEPVLSNNSDRPVPADLLFEGHIPLRVVSGALAGTAPCT